MSKSGKAAGAGAPKNEDLPFEAALKRLESIVEAMEAEELPLEQLIAKFEEGTKLARVCQVKLAEAELKIKQLEKDADGTTIARPLDLSGETNDPESA